MTSAFSWQNSISLCPASFLLQGQIRFKGLDLIESLMNYGWRFVTLYRRQGSRPSPWKRNAKRQNDRILKEELLRLVGAQYATRDQWRNTSRKNGGMEPKQKQYTVVEVTGDRSKV